MSYWPTATHEVAEVQETDVSKSSEDPRLGLARIVQVAPSQAIVKASTLKLSIEAPTATHELVEVQETEKRVLELPAFGLGTIVADST